MQATTPVTQTLKFSVGQKDNEWMSQIIKEFEKIPNLEDFRDAHMICIENDADGHKLQECYGVSIALSELRKNPNAKIVLYGFIPMKAVRNLAPAIDVVLKYDNVRVIEAPFSPGTFNELFRKPKELPETSYVVVDETKKYIGTILHGIHYIPNWEQPEAEQNPRFKDAMKKVYEYFPSFVGKPIPEIIEFLKSASDSREEVMKGVRISGVLCDVEGTILVDGQLNQKVVAKLQEFEQQGKTVCLWTDGDAEHLKKDLESLGISYQVKSKFDHAGAIVEVIIDDQDEYTFSARTKISAEKFIRVSDLT